MNKMRKSAVIITSSEFEDPEVIYPYYRLISAGFSVDISVKNAENVKGKFGFPISSLLKPNKPVNTADLHVANYDLVLVPGGHVAPDNIRQIKEVTIFIKRMFEEGKIVASICHGPWVLISAGILKGIRATCYPSMIDDLKNAGALYYDEPVIVDNNIITSRRPRDLPVFMEEIIKVFENKNK